MSEYLSLSATWLDERFHGRSDGQQPEWPPSPFRFFQSMIAANAHGIDADSPFVKALHWLERQPPPIIVAPRTRKARPYELSVPNNAMDVVARAWSRGEYFGTGDANPSTHNTMKTIAPLQLLDGDTVYYLWSLNGDESPHVAALADAAKRLVSLGWGVDLVVGNGQTISTAELADLPGECWRCTTSTSINALRIPTAGALSALKERYNSFLNRVAGSDFHPVQPVSGFKTVGYRRTTDPVPRPWAAFELRNDDGSLCRYSQRQFIHIAGMVRHLAIELMKRFPTKNVDDEWVDRFVAGHQKNNGKTHEQFSYIPLPSVGHQYADQGVRRVLVAAPVGCDDWLEHLAARLTGRLLVPEKGSEFNQRPPTLQSIQKDSVVQWYTEPANTWASVTPVILPGHTDGKAKKTEKLIYTALAQAGVSAKCKFHWRATSHFVKSYSAHKYDRQKRRIGYFRPDHLATNTAVHLTLHFEEGSQVPGPIAIGAGRHCGFGLMADMRANQSYK